MATHSSILTWRIPWTEEPGGLQSMGLQRVGHDWATQHSTAQPYTSSLETPPFETGGNCWLLPREVQALFTVRPASPLADEEVFPVFADGVERALGSRVFWISRWSTSFLNLLLVLLTRYCAHTWQAAPLCWALRIGFSFCVLEASVFFSLEI